MTGNKIGEFRYKVIKCRSNRLSIQAPVLDHLSDVLLAYESVPSRSALVHATVRMRK